MEWPIDTANADQLTKKLESLRQACEGRVPVGVALCAVSSQQAWFDSVLKSIGSRIDFVTVRMPEVCLPIGASCLAYLPQDPVQVIMSLRRAMHLMAMDDMPVIMDAAWNNGFHAAQGVLAGANFVVADSFVIALKQTSRSESFTTSYDSLSLEGLCLRRSIPASFLEAKPMRLWRLGTSKVIYRNSVRRLFRYETFVSLDVESYSSLNHRKIVCEVISILKGGNSSY